MENRHALIIEDNRLNADVLATLLMLEGFTATTVFVPAELQRMTEDAPPFAVIFLDLEFPHEDGFQLLRKLRADVRFRAVPIIAYTVHLSEIEHTRSAGFNGFLGKPVHAQEFPEQLTRILAGEAVWER